MATTDNFTPPTPAVPFGAPNTPADDLCGTVIEAVSALVAIANALPPTETPPHISGLFHAVRFIADGLQTAANEFETSEFGTSGEGGV